MPHFLSLSGAAPALTQTNNRKGSPLLLPPILPPPPERFSPNVSPSLFPSPVDPVSSSCCFSFIKRPVPLNLLKSFEHTSESCSVAAVVFLTQRGLKICADPSQSWVQDHIRALSAS
uniref:Chemokine interleukin-8-like domain-containing protein n=1 Tax=Pseudonaja textilis TaxID=8673 RepID=A0A670ZSM9_PSETE